VLERQRGYPGSLPIVTEPDSELSALRDLVRQASARNRTLEGIRVGVFLILGLQVALILLAFFGAFRTEVVVFP
jgi:hypothetical protein